MSWCAGRAEGRRQVAARVGRGLRPGDGQVPRCVAKMVHDAAERGRSWRRPRTIWPGSSRSTPTIRSRRGDGALGRLFDRGGDEAWRSAHDPAIAEDADLKAIRIDRRPRGDERGPRAVDRGRRRVQTPHAGRPRLRTDAGSHERYRADQWRSASFQVLLCDYYTAQTYEDPKDPQRRAMLAKVAERVRRHLPSRPWQQMGLYAHAMARQGRHGTGRPGTGRRYLRRGAGQLRDRGADYFSARAARAGWLYAQAKRLRLEITARRVRQDVYHRGTAVARRLPPHYPRTGSDFVRTTEGYQAISLALARALMAQADKAAGEERGEADGRARKVLDDMVKVPAPHQARGPRSCCRSFRDRAANGPSEGPAAVEHKAAAPRRPPPSRRWASSASRPGRRRWAR